MKICKAFKIFITVTLLFSSIDVQSQNTYKVTYTAGIMSGSINKKLSKEIGDPAMRKSFSDLLAQYKVYYSLYIDVKKNKSLFRAEKEDAADGPPPFKYLQTVTHNDAFYLEDLFRAEPFKVSDNVKNVNWQITNETQKIGSFTSRKAILKNDPYNTIAWFTEDMPLSFGPSICFGLPGLVVMCENDYFSVTISKLTPTPLPKDVLSVMERPMPQKAISLAEYYKKVSPLLKSMANESIINQ